MNLRLATEKTSLTSIDLKDDDGETLDWYSDSIIAWAYYPLGVAQTAFEIEKARQAAAVRA